MELNVTTTKQNPRGMDLDLFGLTMRGLKASRLEVSAFTFRVCGSWVGVGGGGRDWEGGYR